MTNQPSLSNGDIWTDVLANASINSYISTTEDDVNPGSIPPVLDSQLSGQPGNIKSNFYGWYDRLVLTSPGGRVLQWESYQTLVGSAVVTKPASSLTLPASASRFVFVNTDGNVVAATTLPNQCVPMAYVTTNGTDITDLVDIRYQRVVVPTVVKLPATVSPWQVGDIKVSTNPTPEPGWLICQGQTLTIAAYPELYAVIGTRYDPLGAAFKLPDSTARSPVGDDGGAVYRGQATVQLSTAQLPPHNHPVSQTPHTHGTQENPHSHTSPPHNHAAVANVHSHTIVARREGTGFGRSLLYDNQTLPDPAAFETAQSINEFSNQPNTVTVNASLTGLQVRTANANVSVGNTGNGQPVSLYHPGFSVYYHIKVSP